MEHLQPRRGGELVFAGTGHGFDGESQSGERVGGRRGGFFVGVGGGGAVVDAEEGAAHH